LSVHFAPQSHTTFPKFKSLWLSGSDALLPKVDAYGAYAPVMQTTLSAAKNEICARACKIAAQFSIATHLNLYDSNMRFLSEYVRDLLLKRLKYIRETENTMPSINLLSFMMPRTVQHRRDASVYVIQHSSHVLGVASVQSLFNIIGVTVTCCPLDFGPGKEYSDVTSYSIYAAFLWSSLKNTWPDVEEILYLRVDIVGNSDENARSNCYAENYYKDIYDMKGYERISHENLDMKSGHILKKISK
jgi:hypothetical protein